MINVSHRIRYLRQLRGYTMDDLAQFSNIPRATLYRYESGDIEGMSIDRIEPLANALSVTPAYLMGWEIVRDVFAPEESAVNIVMQANRMRLPIMEKNPNSNSYTTKLRTVNVFAYENCPKPDCAIVVDNEELGDFSIAARSIVFVTENYEVESGGLYVVMYSGILRVRKYYPMPDGVVLVSLDGHVPPMYFSRIAARRLHIVGGVMGIQYLMM